MEARRSWVLGQNAICSFHFSLFSIPPRPLFPVRKSIEVKEKKGGKKRHAASNTATLAQKPQSLLSAPPGLFSSLALLIPPPPPPPFGLCVRVLPDAVGWLTPRLGPPLVVVVVVSGGKPYRGPGYCIQRVMWLSRRHVDGYGDHVGGEGREKVERRVWFFCSGRQRKREGGK